MKRFAKFICDKRYIVLICSIVLAILSFIGMELTKVNYDILVYLPKDIETIKGQEMLTDDFGMGSYSIAVLENMNSKSIIDLEDKISKVDGVEKVMSLYDVIGTNIPIEMLSSDVKEYLHKDNTDLLFITFTDGTSSEKTIDAVKEIRSLSSDMKQGGMSSMVLDTMELSDKEIMIYIVIAVLLCILVLEVSLDSYLVPILLLLNIGCAILFNLGTNIFMGNISYITKALVAVLQLGVTTDFSIFLYHSYEDKKKKSKNNISAMSEAIGETFKSVVGSSLTTVFGFLVLITMQLTLGRDLGIVMAKGVILGVICVLTLFPSLLLIFDNLIEKTRHKSLKINFNKFNEFIIKKHKLIFIIFLILLIPAYLGYKHVEVYYKIDKSLPDTLESISTNELLKDKYNIVSPEMILISNDLSNDKVNSMVDELKDVDGIEFVLSQSSLAESGITDNMLPSDLVNTLKNDKYQLMLLNSRYEVASDELNNQITIVNDIVKKYDKKAIVAGEGPLMKDLITISDKDFKNVNYSSIICILVILLIVLKSVSLPILLISAIEFAIFINMSISYFGGSVLPFVAPIVLGTIQLGATIDYAILLTTTYFNKRKTIKDKNKAMLETLNYNGNSILVSGLCFFAATFGVGLYSKLEMVGSLCTLISRGAIISMLVVIMVLPSILLIFDKLIFKTTKGGGDKMKKNKKIAVIAVFSSIFLLNTLSVNALSKDEVVYGKLDKNGYTSNLLVNEHLINNDKLDEINDYSTLDNILNINGDETFKIDGNNVKWNSEGKDIFYQGEFSGELPIGISISYKLDGKDSDLEDILGKKGNITICVNYTNKDSHSTEYGTVYTPFVVTLGTILDSKNNTNIKVNNGRVISTGTKDVIVGIASPGLDKSLNSSDLSKLNNIVISFDTDNFELPSMYNVVTPKIISSSDISSLNKLDDLYEKSNLLSENMNLIDESSKKIKDGSNELKNRLGGSIKSLASKTNEPTLTQEQIDSITNETVEGVKSKFNEEKINSIQDTAWNTVKESMNPNDEVVYGIVSNNLNNVILTYLQSVGKDTSYAICNTPDNVRAMGVDVTDEMIEASCQVISADPVLPLIMSSAKSIALETANYVAESVSKNVASSVSYQTALETASLVTPTVSTTVADAVKKSSIDTISSSLNELYNGVEKLDNGIGELSEGISKYNEEGIKVLSNTVDEKIKPTSIKVKRLVNLGENYRLETNKEFNSSAETKFVLVLDGKKKEVKETKQTSDTKKDSIIDRIKNLFK